MTHKTCTTFTLFKQGIPIKRMQTRWSSTMMMFTMSNDQFHLWMDGYCTAMTAAIGDEYTYDHYDNDEHFSLTVVEI